jgi:hypothetical protein
MRRILAILTAVVLGLAGWPALAPAQDDERCFPETGECLSGRFREYWEQNGDLAVFGYPITPAQPELNREDGQTYLTQWFERNRFELHPENPPPYDVLLGRLGDDRLRQLGIDWQAEPPRQSSRGLFFEQSGHNVCDQEEEVGFVRYYLSHGLNNPALDEYGQSLALFGLPLTEARPERTATGEMVLTQWFERARFEWHPNNPDEYKVLLGLLGREVQAGQAT